ncbi:tRNA lysidine(34) synthetase TilS [Haliangium sp.]|uniref:tRNA lysidine(34) synthetase TilS n=1 Tax=Haliangium sp. TaxID=2663208 RepID=UPI003D108F49
MHELEQRIAAVLARHRIGAGDTVGVACSGGPDSAVLAHACLVLARAGALAGVVLLHVDHGLRPDAGRDAELVRDLAARGGGQVEVRRVSVDRARASLEAAARDARYAALDDMARERGLTRVLLAHTASDQAETVLMRLLRGAGVSGLAAIPPARGRYLRPLLDTTRAEIEAYRDRFDVPVVADPMNLDPAFLRVRVRRRWLPALRAENPRLDQALCRLAGSARQQREVLDYAAAALVRAATLVRAVGPGPAPGGGDPGLDLDALSEAPAAVRRRALAVVAEGRGLGPLEARHQALLDRLVARAEAGTVTQSLPGGRAVREYGRIRFELAAAGAEPGPDDDPGDPGADLDVSGPDGPYQVRRWRPGDRMCPARLRGRSRKLGRLFIDAKLPRRLRPLARVVVRVRDGVIVWAEHLGPAHGAAVRVALTGPSPAASNDMAE